MEIKNKKLINIFYKLFPEEIINNHTFKIKQFVGLVVKKTDKKGKEIIDIGAGECPYKSFFKKAKYYSQDIKNNSQKNINYVCPAEAIPVKNNTFDYILSTQVLEHTPEPNLVFKECFRILKKDGQLFLTTHMAFEEHMAPKDYFRFTRYGLKHLAKISGFKVRRITPQGGRFIVLAKELQVLFLRLTNNKFFIFIFYLVFTLPLFLLSFVLFLLDSLDKEKSLTLNYECIFIK
ncbi:hypothetical protein COT75_05015 [Candidatus Beckwithbacteria bacterium CG10_big_fil_rev_8_21_14_0_10_34_10]|uniref:Methyltransferase type 11 domain-containing protein n=1 Tax=Candidatus Beckwithbacteria bacterium CG10_big_fil_rev_8_21_14_0_10_34_10 TaxID=1974495 RepID=A0A2H0W816_9BACT|nr:MAG: hypothetical protein COT75_05015 [Candidatus Beckwithbacteria bacterium CG10_big_fil_rev_8_21_14_0_10_34_10]